MMREIRNYTIITGSKRFFDNQIASLLGDTASGVKNDFLYMVRKHDEYSKRVTVKGVSEETDDDFEKTGLLIVRNADYHGIVKTAHDRLGALIEDLTLDNAQIFVHNPTIALDDYLHGLKEQERITLDCMSEKYLISTDLGNFSNSMRSILQNIIGQNEAVCEACKSMWYLTQVGRKSPFVIMLYGNSGIGKTELVREIATHFFGGKALEKHLSMFKNENTSYYLFGDDPNRVSIGFDLLERESNLVFLDEFDKLPDYFYSVFYTLFDNVLFKDATYQVDISRLLIFLTSNYSSLEEMRKHLGLPIFFRIDKFIHFNDFSGETIHEVTKMEIKRHLSSFQNTIDENEIYHRVCQRIKIAGENARTIKNIIQQEVEDLLFEEVSKG